MLKRRQKLQDRCQGRCFKPELLAKYDADDLTFTSWLTSVKHTVYGGQNCYVLQFSLHFMDDLSARKRLRGAKFEVEVQCSGTEDPKMLFVRTVGSSGQAYNHETSTTRRISNNAHTGDGGHDNASKFTRRKPPPDGPGGASGIEFVQGIVLPPRRGLWKIWEPPENKRGIPRQVKLQALVGCDGGFGIEVKDFQVKVGHWAWLWPNRVLQAIGKGPESESSTLPDNTTRTDTGQRPASIFIVSPAENAGSPRQAQQEPEGTHMNVPSMNASKGTVDVSMLYSKTMSILPEKTPDPTLRDTNAHGGMESEHQLFTLFQIWLDSMRDFDKAGKLELGALREFIDTTYGRTQLSRYSKEVSYPVTGGQASKGQNDEKTLIGQLKWEGDLLEAWLRREGLRKQAMETRLDTSRWMKSSGSKSRISPVDHSVTKPERPLEIALKGQESYDYTAVGQHERCNQPRREKRDELRLDKCSVQKLPAGGGASVASDVPELNLDPLKGDRSRRVWTIHEDEPKVSAKMPSREAGVSGPPPKVTPTTEAESPWSPSRAWKELSPRCPVPPPDLRSR